MAWIKSYDDDSLPDDAFLEELYRQERDPSTGQLDHILSVHSLFPQSLADHAQLYHSIMHNLDGELSLTERELIGVVVSVLNECHY